MTDGDAPLKVAVLGGGMAGLAAAWRLTEPGAPACEVTVYQRGWRLGGKGASSRGRHGRIEEHGLHVWLGFYDNAFKLIRDCYTELDREGTDPGCPIRSWRDAFFPAGSVAVGDDTGAAWEDWVAAFPDNDAEPGSSTPASADVADVMQRTVELIALYGESLAPHEPPRRAVLSTTAAPPARRHTRLVTGLAGMVSGPTPTRRVRQNLEVLMTMVRGMLRDGVMQRGLRALDDLDFCEWLAGHGASPDALRSPLILAMYDFIFGFEEGDRERPRFAAGIAIELAVQLFGRYKGAIFWKMRAGMGDVVFAPLYQALVARGVRFEFFHRVDALHLGDDGRSITAVSLGRQVDLAPGVASYDPLIRVQGLPVFPDRPDARQLAADTGDAALEQHGVAWADAGAVRLSAGRDFDRVVLAVSLGMLPHVAAELIASRPAWTAMVDNVGTVATQALQLWLEVDERTLGWSDAASVLTRLGPPFDTFASSSHTIPFESWPADHRPAAAAMFCSALAPGSEAPTADVAANVCTFLGGNVQRLWPDAVGPSGFRWDWLWADAGTHGAERLDAQYWRANSDPSDRYVQSLPGTDRHRLRADGSGIDNLFLAGDWIDSGLNAGCIEAAALAGLQAGNAASGRPLTEATFGFRPHRGQP